MDTLPKVHAHLDAERRAATLAKRRKTSIQLMLVALICLTVFAVLDYFIVFNQLTRIFCFLVLAALVGWQYLHVMRARHQSISRKRIAEQVERLSGRDTVVLTTASDDHVRTTSSADEIGASLLQRLDDQAVELASSYPLNSQESNRPWRRGLISVAVAAAVFAVVGGWWSYSRVLVPWAKLSYTRVQMDGPTDRIAALTPFEFTGQLRGRKATTVHLHRSFADKPLRIPVRPDGKFNIALPGIAEAETFWASAGDGTSRRIEVKVFKPAEFAEFRIRVQPPSYASHLEKTHDGPNFEVLRGCKLDYSVRLTQEIESLNLIILPDGSGRITGPVPFKPTGDPLEYRLETDRFSRDLNYRLEVTHSNGEVSRNDEPFRILTLDDDPPHMTITGHNGDEVVKIGDEDVTVQLKGTDDVGLASAKLVYRKIGNAGESRDVDVAGRFPLQMTAASLLELADLDLQPFDVVAIHAEGTDGNTFDGPGIGKSQVVMIEVPEPPRDDEQQSGGGGGGGQAQVVNPLEMQKYILQDTSKLLAKASSPQFEDLQKDQEEANHFAELLLNNVKAKTATNPRARGLAAQLELAVSTMKLSSRQLSKTRRDQSVLAQEFAVATLSKAAQMMGGPT